MIAVSKKLIFNRRYATLGVPAAPRPVARKEDPTVLEALRALYAENRKRYPGGMKSGRDAYVAFAKGNIEKYSRIGGNLVIKFRPQRSLR